MEFDAAVAGRFLELFQDLHSGSFVLEPRHQSWFEKGSEDLLNRFHIARVAADPALVPSAAEPGGWRSLVYFRLHGTPRVYYSAYPSEFLQKLVVQISSIAQMSTVWCIFDNTAAGAATANALIVLKGVTGAPSQLSAL